MRIIIRTLGKDHLHGTAEPGQAREDFAVHVADADELLAQEASQMVTLRDGADVTESMEIKRWLKRLGDGEPNAYDILFAPDSAVLERDDEAWAEILPVARAQVSKRLDGFVSYVRRIEARARRDPPIDPRSLRDAARVADQALELLRTGRVTFPRADARQLAAIRAGAVAPVHVADALTEVLAEIEKAALDSSLPDEPDREWAARYVRDVHKRAIVDAA